MIHCKKLNKEAEGLAEPPFSTAIGKRIHEEISEEAWQLWLQHQTMLINEYRLSLLDPKSRAFLMEEVEKFLFGAGSEKPSGFVPT
jgi:Fe-S cluster biosynthesis and repair protein YggX